jgi:hypothetical protein
MATLSAVLMPIVDVGLEYMCKEPHARKQLCDSASNVPVFWRAARADQQIISDTNT